MLSGISRINVTDKSNKCHHLDWDTRKKKEGQKQIYLISSSFTRCWFSKTHVILEMTGIYVSSINLKKTVLQLDIYVMKLYTCGCG